VLLIIIHFVFLILLNFKCLYKTTREQMPGLPSRCRSQLSTSETRRSYFVCS
jgi:hypothetical protein